MDDVGDVMSVTQVCSVPQGQPVAWPLYHRQRRQILLASILEHRASFPLVDVKGLVMATIRSRSVTFLEIFGRVRVTNRDDIFVVEAVVEGEGLGGVNELFWTFDEIP